MLHLTTGANGTGKTLLTLKMVHERAQKESRPVCYNGRFRRADESPIEYWRQIDIKDWQSQPDGTIFVVDECHNEFPMRGSAEKVPEYVKMLAEHRARGFDFYLITQHPQNIDLFVRRLVGNPGWHRHLKRVAGAEIVSVLQWDAVNGACEKQGAGKSGQVTMVPYPKEVYKWYHSAQLHTAQRKIPRAVWVVAACVVAVPLLGWLGVHSLFKSVDPRSQGKPQVQGVTGAPGASGRAASTSGDVERRPITAAEYVADRMPRINGLAYTAPAYDKVTEPAVAPYPAACVLHHGSGACDCYSQQATRLATPKALCEQIARNGVFIDWKQEQAGSQPVGGVQRVASGQAGPVAASATASAPPAPAPAVIPPAVAASGAVAMLSAPTASPPVFFPASTSAGEPAFVGQLTASQAQDSDVWSMMRKRAPR